MNRFTCFFVVAVALFISECASAQVQQTGAITPSHLACWAQNGVIQDCGGSPGAFATALGVYGNGGTPLTVTNFKNTNVAGYGQLGVGASTTETYIASSGTGSYAGLPFNLDVNGYNAIYVSPTGMVSFPTGSVIGDGGINVRAPPYNAACDGTTDDTAALTAARASGAINVYVTKGSGTGLCITSQLVLSAANQTWNFGPGAGFKIKTGQSSKSLLVVSGSGVTLNGPLLDGGSVGGSVGITGLEIDSSNVTVKGITVQNTDGFGIYMQSPASNLTFNGAKVSNCVGSGNPCIIYTTPAASGSPHDLVFNDILVDQSGLTSSLATVAMTIRGYQATPIKIQRVTFNNITIKMPTGVSNNAVGLEVLEVTNLNSVNTTIYGSSIAYSTGRVAQCSVSNVNATSFDVYGFEATDDTYCAFNNLTLNGLNALNGIASIGTTSATNKYNAFSNFVVSGLNSTGFGGQKAAGIFVGNSSDNVFTNGWIDAMQPNGASGSSVCVYDANANGAGIGKVSFNNIICEGDDGTASGVKPIYGLLDEDGPKVTWTGGQIRNVNGPAVQLTASFAAVNNVSITGLGGTGNSTPLTLTNTGGSFGSSISMSGDAVILSTFPATILNASAAVYSFTGTGSPESAVTAGVGSQFYRTDNSGGDGIYFKKTGSGNTGWLAATVH